MKLEISNMNCGGCARSVMATIKGLDPDAQVNIDLETKIVDVETTTDTTKLAEALAEDGYPPVIKA